MIRDWLSILLNTSPIHCIEMNCLPYIKLWVIERLVLDFYVVPFASLQLSLVMGDISAMSRH